MFCFGLSLLFGSRSLTWRWLSLPSLLFIYVWYIYLLFLCGFISFFFIEIIFRRRSLSIWIKKIRRVHKWGRRWNEHRRIEKWRNGPINVRFYVGIFILFFFRNFRIIESHRRHLRVSHHGHKRIKRAHLWHS